MILGQKSTVVLAFRRQKERGSMDKELPAVDEVIRMVRCVYANGTDKQKLAVGVTVKVHYDQMVVEWA